MANFYGKVADREIWKLDASLRCDAHEEKDLSAARRAAAGGTAWTIADKERTMLQMPADYAKAYEIVDQRIGLDRTPIIVGIDGRCGVGKSSLASWLCWQFGMPAIHLDLFIYSKFPLMWRWSEIARCIQSRNSRPLVIEGVMLDQVLASVGKQADLRIHVERLLQSTSSRPRSESEQDTPGSVDGQVDLYLATRREADIRIRVDY